jgi:hypothetical protein
MVWVCVLLSPLIAGILLMYIGLMGAFFLWLLGLGVLLGAFMLSDAARRFRGFLCHRIAPLVGVWCPHRAPG